MQRAVFLLALGGATLLIGIVTPAPSSESDVQSNEDEAVLAEILADPEMTISDEEWARRQASGSLEQSISSRFRSSGIQIAYTQWKSDEATQVVGVKRSPETTEDEFAEFQSAVLDHFNGLGVTIEIAEAQHTSDELLAAADTLFAEKDSWARGSVDQIIGAGPDPVNGEAIIWALTDVPDAIIESASLMVNVPVRVEITERPTDATRFVDTSPWTAGNALTHIPANAGTSRHHCSEGYAWRRWDTGVVHAGSAGHCWGTGTSVYQSTSDQRIGYVNHRSLHNSTADALLILLRWGIADNSVWVTALSGGTLLREVVAVDPEPDDNIGATVCASGATTLRRCGEIALRNQTITTESGTVFRLTCVRMDRTIIGGDSGGPILSTLSGSGNVVAYGQIKGFGFPGGDCATFYSTVINISAELEATILIN
ncbi:chymotrypsin family serine protease [Jiangella alkaliphila]|uniref:Trypsin n=2 Tax=Jiangella alkaliphila TaxID=419479 RepID=A0A1H2L906_9ACTN|nr:hypothetical protein [Jiangella alkaliphila]SDU77195.1 hypothetical protein SAMN04488563_5453 [Jiangella alkaliphila]